MSDNDFNSQSFEEFDDSHLEEDVPCAAARAGLPRRQDYGLNLNEDVCLNVVRDLLSMFVTGDARHWDRAMDFCEVHLGESSATQMVAQVSRFVRALRIERTCAFSFLSFGCQHITQDELALISTLQTLQVGSSHDIKDALQYLSQSNSYPRLELATRALSEFLAASKPKGTTVHAKRDLCDQAFSANPRHSKLH